MDVLSMLDDITITRQKETKYISKRNYCPTKLLFQMLESLQPDVLEFVAKKELIKLLLPNTFLFNKKVLIILLQLILSNIL